MNQSIYTEYTNLTPDHVAWLDGCGAVWGMEQKFTEFTPTMECVAFNKFFYQDKKDFYQNNPYTYIPTGSEFCERVAEILGIEKPVFASDLKDKLVKKLEMHDRMERPLPEVDITKTETTTYPHRTYRVLESLEGVPFDKRIPLSEWIPPFGVDLIFISDADWYRGIVHAMDQRFIYLLVKGEEKECIVPLDGHWMRIV